MFYCKLIIDTDLFSELNCKLNDTLSLLDLNIDKKNEFINTTCRKIYNIIGSKAFTTSSINIAFDVRPKHNFLVEGCTRQDIEDETDALIFLYADDDLLHAKVCGLYPYNDSYSNSCEITDDLSAVDIIKLLFDNDDELISFITFGYALEFSESHESGCIYAKACDTYPYECACAAEKKNGGYKYKVYRRINS